MRSYRSAWLSIQLEPLGASKPQLAPPRARGPPSHRRPSWLAPLASHSLASARRRRRFYGPIASSGTARPAACRRGAYRAS